MLKAAWLTLVFGFFCVAAKPKADDFNQAIYALTLEELMQVKTISLATGTQKSLRKAPAVATVITSAEIANLGANSIYDILKEVVGVHIYPSPVNRMNPSYSIRGIHTSNNPQTLLLTNGVRISYEFSGARWDQLQIATENIDRIEVIRGPGSAVYGSDAYSGVINIITKGVNSEATKSLGVKAGSFGTQSLWANYVQNDEKLQYSFNGQYFHTDGDSGRIVEQDRMHVFGPSGVAISNAPGALDTRRETFDLRSEVKFGGFHGSLWYLKNNSGTGAGIGNALSIGDWEKLQGITLMAGYQWQENTSFNHAVNLSYQKMNRETYFIIFPAGFSIPRAFDDSGTPTAFTVFTEGYIGAPYANDQYFNAGWVTQYSGVAGHNIRFEVGYRKSKERPEEYKNFGPGVLDGSEDFVDDTLTDVTNTPYIYLDDKQRELVFLSLQDEWQINNDWEFVAGARFDRYSDFGSTFNPRLALVWDSERAWTAKFLYGQAFRAPSMQELYITNNPLTLGSADLKPETIGFYEAVFDYHNDDNWQLTANIYTYEAQDLIATSIGADDINRFNNVGEQDGYGVEIEAKWQLTNRLKSRLGYSWQRAESGIDGQYIPDAPKQVMNLSFDWRVDERFGVHVNAHWVMDRLRSAGDSRAPIDDYVWTNLIFSYQFNDRLTSKLSIRNLFDSDARHPANTQLPDDFPAEGRGIWFSLDYRL